LTRGVEAGDWCYGVRGLVTGCPPDLCELACWMAYGLDAPSSWGGRRERGRRPEVPPAASRPPADAPEGARRMSQCQSQVRSGVRAGGSVNGHSSMPEWPDRELHRRVAYAADPQVQTSTHRLISGPKAAVHPRGGSGIPPHKGPRVPCCA
jgi:hypothetical protein